MFALSRAMYLFDANLNLVANTSTTVLRSTTYSRTSLPADCWSSDLTEREIPMQYYTSRRCTTTNAQRANSVMIALTGGTAFLRFY